MAVDAITLLALTGFRRDEVLGLEWDEVDFERRLIHLQDDKAGSGRLKALGSVAMAILRRRHESADDDAVWVFPSNRTPGPRRYIQGTVDAVYEAAKICEATAHHVWRHTFTTHAAELGLPSPIIGAMVGHKDSSMTGRYSHLTIDGMVRAADERVQSRIARALEGDTAEVIDLGERMAVS